MELVGPTPYSGPDLFTRRGPHIVRASEQLNEFSANLSLEDLSSSDRSQYLIAQRARCTGTLLPGAAPQEKILDKVNRKHFVDCFS